MIEGSLHCSNSKMMAGATGCALDAQRMVVKGKFDLRGAKLSGLVNLVAAHVGTLADNNSSWIGSTLHLDGFQYDRIQGSEKDIKSGKDKTRTDAESRITWLELQDSDHRGSDFRPQPWQQLIKILREMGHPDEASKVAIKKEELWGRSGQMNWIRWSLHRLHGWLASYGYRPLRAVRWIGGAAIFFALVYCIGDHNGLFGPIAPAVQISQIPELDGCGTPSKPWTSTACQMPPAYPRFNPLIYSLDLILPFVDLQQESQWAPIAAPEGILNGRGLLRFAVWFEIIFGWLMSLLLLAALGRVLNRD